LAVVGVASLAHAQVDRATLSGVVRDQTGAVVPNASVAVTNSATNVGSRTKTNAEAAYLAVNLVPGRYLVEVEAAGFEKKVDAVILEVGQRARLDLTIGVGTMSEAVTVEAALRLLSTDQAALGAVMDENALGKLPLGIPNWDDLLALVPGGQGGRFTDLGDGPSFGGPGASN